jgi:hypothetical protein
MNQTNHINRPSQPCQIFPPKHPAHDAFLPAMSSSEEARALARAEFWDERYAKADGDKPTHEWFRAFDALQPFFQKHLFDARGAGGKSQRVLHLGSGDSVRGSLCKICTALFGNSSRTDQSVDDSI